MLQKTFKHRVLIWICYYIYKFYLIFKKRLDRLDSKYQWEFKLEAEQEMADFLKAKGPTFIRDLEEQDYCNMVPLGTCLIDPPILSLNELRCRKFKHVK